MVHLKNARFAKKKYNFSKIRISCLYRLSILKKSILKQSPKIFIDWAAPGLARPQSRQPITMMVVYSNGLSLRDLDLNLSTA